MFRSNIEGTRCSNCDTGVGSAIGVGIAGEAADGVMSGDKVSLVQLLYFRPLPRTQGIYGTYRYPDSYLRLNLGGNL